MQGLWSVIIHGYYNKSAYLVFIRKCPLNINYLTFTYDFHKKYYKKIQLKAHSKYNCCIFMKKIFLTGIVAKRIIDLQF